MFLRVLLTEILKLKRTLALWMVLVSPLVMVLLNSPSTAKRPVFISTGRMRGPYGQAIHRRWTLLMMPMSLPSKPSPPRTDWSIGKELKSLLALPATALDDLCEQVGCDNQSLGGTRRPGCGTIGSGALLNSFIRT